MYATIKYGDVVSETGFDLDTTYLKFCSWASIQGLGVEAMMPWPYGSDS